jgi:hypothetical protein
MKRKLIAATLTAGMSLTLVAVPASAHPIDSPGHSGAVGRSQGHVNGLECAARQSPVIGELGLPCAADRRATP